MPSVADLKVTITADTREAERGIDSLGQKVDGAGKKMGGASGAVGGLTKGLGSLGLAAAGVSAAIEGVKGLGSVFGLGALNEMEQTRASFNAFTKDAGKTEEIMAQVRTEAAKTPFAFGEMAKATASLMPVAKSSGAALMDLVKEAEILAASNPLEGLEGASFSLREAMTGDFTSIIERFNLSRTTINKLKDEGVPNLEIVRRAMAEMGFDSDLIAAKAETLDGRWSTFMDTLETLQTRMGEPIFNAMKEGLVTLQGTLDSNMGMFESWADTVAAGMKDVIRVSKDLFDVFMGGDSFDAAAEVLDKLFPPAVTDGILTVVDNLGLAFDGLFRVDLPTLLSGAQGVVSGFGEIIAGFVEDWAGKIAAWVDTASPDLLSNLGDMALEMQGWLLDTGLTIVEKLGVWAAAFVDWIAPKIPDLLRELGAYLVKLTTWVATDALPKILGKLAEWGLAFIEWVAPRIPPLLAELASLLLELTGWVIGTALPSILGKLVEWGAAFVEWVGPQIPRLLIELAILQVRLIAWVGEQVVKITTALAAWGLAFVEWIATDVLPALPGELLKILTAVDGWVAEKASAFAESVKTLGSGMVTGIRDGVSGALGGFWSWLQENFVDKIPSFVRELLDINSPSGVFIGIGQNMVEGLRVGMQKRLPSIDKLISDVLGRFGGGTGNEMLQRIGAIAAQIGGADFARAAVAISASETGGGKFLAEIGGTGAQGPFQFDPGGELRNFAKFLGVSLEQAGLVARMQPMLAAKWALEGYLGDALKQGLSRGLTGASLAVYGSRVGQRPREGLEHEAGEWFRRLFPGYAAGGWAGLHGPELAMLGERGPEYVIPNHALRSGIGGGGTSTHEFIVRDPSGRVLADWYVTGRELAIRTRRVPAGAT